MYLHNGLKFDITQWHMLDKNYPPFHFADAVERERVGITEVADIPQPDPALFDSTPNPDGTWTSTPKDPAVIEAERKARAYSEANAVREAELNAGFLHNGKRYHCDPVFQGQIVGFIAAYREGILPDAYLASIRTHANVNTLMSRAELLAMAGAMMAHVQGIYARSWAVKDAL